jgi:hypothetical protein
MAEYSPQDLIDMEKPALEPVAKVPEASKTPSFMEWLSSPEAMAYASGMLEASGPSTTPISFGQAMGMGGKAMLQAKLQFGNQQLDKDKFGYQKFNDNRDFELKKKDHAARQEDRKMMGLLHGAQIDKWKYERDRQQRADAAFLKQLPGGETSVLGIPLDRNTPQAASPEPQPSQPGLLNSPTPSPMSPSPQATLPQIRPDSQEIDAKKVALAQSLYFSGKEKEAFEVLNGSINPSYGRPFQTKDPKTGKPAMAVIDQKTAKIKFLDDVAPPDQAGLFVQTPDGTVIAQGKAGDVQQMMSKPSQKAVGDFQEGISKTFETLGDLDQIAKTYGDQYLTYTGGAQQWVDQKLDKAGLLQDSEFLKGATTFKTGLDQFFNAYRKEITGAAASVQELDRLKASIMNSDMSPAEFKATYAAFREKIDRGLGIKQKLLREGIPAGSKEFGSKFDDLFFSKEPVQNAAGNQNKDVSPSSVGMSEQEADKEIANILATSREIPQAPLPSNDTPPASLNTMPSQGNLSKETRDTLEYISGLGPLKNAQEGIMLGLGKGAAGIGQLALGGLEKVGAISPETLSSYNNYVQDAIKRKENQIGDSYLGKAGTFGGELILPLGAAKAAKGVKYLDEILGGAKSGAGLLNRALTGAAGGAAIGASQFVPEGGSRETNAKVGAALGGILSPATAAVSGGIGKIWNAVKGRASTPEQQAVIDAGKKFDVPVMAADVSPKSGTVDNLTRYAEEVPLAGVVKARTNQMNKAQDAAETLADSYKDRMMSTEFGGKTGLKKLEKAAQGGGMRAGKAREILKEIENAGDDWNTVIKASGDVSLFRRKLIGDQKYNKVEKMADQFGAVPKDDTINSINNAIQENAESILPDSALNAKLVTILENIQSKEMNYSQMRQARSVISGIIDDFYKGNNAAVGSKGVGAIQNIKSSIEKDMNRFAQNNGPELRTAWKNADSFHQKAIVPFKSAELARAMTGKPADEIYSMFVKSGTREGSKGTGRADVFYKALDDKGRAAVRYGMIEEALAKSIRPAEKGFSPAQFASAIEKVGAAKGVFFKGIDKVEVDGFTNLMRHIERAGQMNKPDTGIRAVPTLLAGLYGGAASAAGASIPGAIAGYAATVAPLRALLTTKAGRNILISSSRLKPGSPQMDNIQRRVEEIIQKSAVVGATSPGRKENRGGR